MLSKKKMKAAVERYGKVAAWRSREELRIARYELRTKVAKARAAYEKARAELANVGRSRARRVRRTEG